MPKPKHQQMDFLGLELKAAEFTGQFNGILVGALTAPGSTNVAVTATTGTLPTPDGSVTIANAAIPTVVELLEFCMELRAKQIAIQAALD